MAWNNQNNLPAPLRFSTHPNRFETRTCRIADSIADDSIPVRYGNPFGAVGDGRPSLVSRPSVLEAEDGGKVAASTRFEWGVDWKGFDERRGDSARGVDEEVNGIAGVGGEVGEGGERVWGVDGGSGGAELVTEADGDAEASSPLAIFDRVPGRSDFVVEVDRVVERGADGIAGFAVEAREDEGWEWERVGVRNGSSVGAESGDDADDEREYESESQSDGVGGCLSLSIHMAVERMEEMDLGVEDV